MMKKHSMSPTLIPFVATISLAVAALSGCATSGMQSGVAEPRAAATANAKPAPAAAKNQTRESARPVAQTAPSASPFTAAQDASLKQAVTAELDVVAAPGMTAIDLVDATDANTNFENLWERIRAGFRLAPMEGPFVAQHEQWFSRNSEYMERMLQRANLYLFHIVEEVEKRGMPMEIALLPAIESAYQPHAYSRARAVGLWQFIPSTGRLYGLESNWWYDGRRDVMASTRAALDYLEKLSRDFNGDWQLALAAYNCGEGRVGRAIKTNERKGLPTNYEDLPLPLETRHYVPKLMAMVNIVRAPEKYGLELREIPNRPYFVQVDTDSQIDLNVVAKLTNVSVDDLHNMNPAFNRWATAPNGPHRILLPVSAKDAFLEGLNDLPAEQRVQWARHEVKRGEVLTKIARNFGVTPDAIREANNLSGNRVRVGQNLLIPVSGRKLVVDSRHTGIAGTRMAKANPTVHGGKVRVIHRVRRGETLWSIAKRYGVYVKDLTKWNVLKGREAVRAGQKLLIWTDRKVSDAETQGAG